MSNCARTDHHCQRCEGPLPFAFSMAFQPIVDVATQRIVTHEALVRGINGDSAYQVLSQVSDTLLYRFDQACRVKAIELAARLEMQSALSINFLPNAVYEPEACIQATLAISERVGWPAERLVFEITETESVTDRAHLRKIIDTHRQMGFTTALDDFGKGHANLDLLVDLRPDKLKIDRALVMDCHQDTRRQVLLKAVVDIARQLEIDLVAEGIERREEARWLHEEAGIVQHQGFYYARPAFEALPPIHGFAAS
ncbi:MULTISPECIES: EAL domain-containing protein [Chromohalobacter]|uniref:EAL domain-containing protein n=1 Tax=Chromohalobacter TaxID=42054 RepID=UPI001FFD7BDF|nr:MULTISPECIES: EAL domain-containing protein [Chromohalobacter]MCK2045515.1 EAL domain-containing protein [Chromohalobacter moromii]MCT8468421.1 EAL domain-containing protein [Chromohalobacter canadensis]MCT8471476.1 EAL domain-containing protein [Chromohalobacter canadensis]MCT8498929.1 EAL domain-containing protein [Chromohalobacter canadensis]